MEPEGSLKCSRETTICPHSEPDNLVHTIPSHPLPQGPILLLVYHLRLYLPSSLIPSGFPIKILHE